MTACAGYYKYNTTSYAINYVVVRDAWPTPVNHYIEFSNIYNNFVSIITP